MGDMVAWLKAHKAQRMAQLMADQLGPQTFAQFAAVSAERYRSMATDGRLTSTMILRDQGNPARATQELITEEAAAALGYRTILIDPPWQYKTTVPGSKRRSAEDERLDRAFAPYLYLTDREIADLPILGLAGPAAHLYLWTTNTHIPVAFDIVKAWGFKYSTLLVWRKPTSGNAGFPTYPIKTEYVLFCRLGTLPSLDRAEGNTFGYPEPDGDTNPWDARDSEYLFSRQVHSKKPPEFIEMFEELSPGPHIEIFAREYRMGWRSMGIELSGQDIRKEINAEIDALNMD